MGFHSTSRSTGIKSECERGIENTEKKELLELLLWYSGLRIWHCHSCDIGCSWSLDSIPGPGISICLRYSQKRKKKKKSSFLPKKVSLTLWPSIQDCMMTVISLTYWKHLTTFSRPPLHVKSGKQDQSVIPTQSRICTRILGEGLRLL